MQKSSFKRRLEQAGLELVWRQWTEAGVSGWSDGSNFAVDPEALILLTALFGDVDPRLRDEATDWCITYNRFISAARLRNMLRDQPKNVRSAFGPFAATVNAHAAGRWPEATRPRRYVPTKRSRINDFTKSSLIDLRLRALFGVSARAEIIRVLLGHDRYEWTTADLAQDILFTKRNVAEALDALKMGGLIEAATLRNLKVHRVKNALRLHEFVGPIGPVFIRWPEIVRVFAALLELAERFAKMDERVRIVEAAKFLKDHEQDLRRADITPPTNNDLTDLVTAFEHWAVTTFEGLASGSPPAAASLS